MRTGNLACVACATTSVFSQSMRMPCSSGAAIWPHASCASTEEAQAGISALQRAGAVVRVFALDVCDEKAVADMIADLRGTMPPLRGVIHAAMVLDDGIALNLNRERMHKVMAPKVHGAW